MEKPIEPWASWEPCPQAVSGPALTRLAEALPQFFADSSPIEARLARLPFYRTHRLLELTFVRDHGPERAFVLDDGTTTRWLDGNSAPIHDTNDAEDLELTDETAPHYLRYFCYFLRSDEGAFTIVENPTDLTAEGHDDAWFEQFRDKLDLDVAELWMRLQTLRGHVSPLSLQGRDDQGRWTFRATVAYGQALSGVTFAVRRDGPVEMVDDEPLGTFDGITVVRCPDLSLESRPVSEPDEDDDEDDDAPVAIDPSAPNVIDRRKAAERRAHRVDTFKQILSRQTQLPRDREVTQAVVQVLLEDALRERESNLLLRHFNSETAADKPIEGLTRLVVNSSPIIVIESDIPFVEDFVAGLIDGPDRVASQGQITRAEPVSGDDSRCWINFSGDRAQLYLFSFHAYRSLWDAEHTTHVLSIRDAAVLIGADRLSDVPEPLRRAMDLRLTFPRIDRRLFPRIFEGVFQAKPAPGWESAAGEGDWTRYLVPADFHAPRRLGLDPDRALAFLRDRVASRLKQVTPEHGPALTELHGLGEARQIAEDLIADIRSAQAGTIPWSAVDRGLLLVGAPGTGKTTLGRAIAKQCGVKFIVASAAKWQAAGALDSHLRAIRADFAEARRYAPSILFLDEIDSLGNREQLSGPNAHYQTEVINAVLDQIQGIESNEPVMVIAATNYLDKVDPALRRAGRLDQIVQIPRPNIASLIEIFRYYLAPHRNAGQVGAEVDERALSELAFGLTGADVEFFVRGAARRARRERRPIAQADLLAEVTRRPRRADSAPRLGPAEMRRTAVHEAGHALARLISSTGGEDLSFITIIPRLDGSLGFVASVPLDGTVATRRTMLEELETVLAGRAAEEVVYGADDVGLGAGGPDARNDLAVATRIARLLVCQSGLGEDGALQWSETPSPAQERQIDALLRKSYAGIVARIQAHRDLLDRIIEALAAKQELSRVELKQMLGGVVNAGGASASRAGTLPRG